jgi:3-isopropylmalate/(R)-2-methylmalate dehydratase large subunit
MAFKPPASSVPLTLSEKIIARAAGRTSVRPGQIVTCKVDLAMMHDSGGPRRVAPQLERLGAKVWDPDKVVIVTDHFVPAVDVDSAGILALTRRWAREQHIEKFYDMQGICHVVVQEHGHLRPGMFTVGGDSHSPSGGAVGAFMIGIGATEMTGVLVTGEIWVRVPATDRLHWRGRLGAARSAKDVMLHLCATIGMNNDYKVMEFCGPAITELAMAERLVLCNMSAELGAKTGIVAPDARTVAAIRDAGGKVDDGALAWQSDADASFARTLEFDATALEPQVAAPHSPANSSAASNHGTVAIDQAYIGACTGAKLSDLKMAATVLKGHKVAPGVRLLIAPASTQTTQNAAADGTLATLTAAGAILLPSGCGACAGLGAGVLADDEVCIASTARNFKGRMGSAKSKVYLGSPYTVAASAITGRITDPREFVG